MRARVDALSLIVKASPPDPGLGWLYVAAKSGDLTVFDIGKPGVVLLGHDHPGDGSHSVAVDPATHRVFFPLMKGPNERPGLC